MKCRPLPGNHVAAACILAALLAAAGCQTKMSEHGRIVPLEEDGFFSDGSSAREPVPGTVARENLKIDTLFFTGREPNGDYAVRYPFPVDDAVLSAGQDRFAIFCAVCHGAQGAGDGMVVKRGFTKPLPFRDPRVLQDRPGYLFSVMTRGFRTMAPYRDAISEQERWSIAAYIKQILQAGAK